MKIAAGCYPVERFDGFLGFVEKQDAWLGAAARRGADLLVLPEYAAMELSGFAGAEAARDLEKSMQAVSSHLPEYWDLMAELARRHRVHLLTGSGPYLDGENWVNRAMFVTPGGARQPHDKQLMTPWERDPMGLAPGAPLTLMETAIGRIGVLICYDVEFPLLARALVEAGAEILLVPSQTDAGAGYNRVCIGARARALEGQCITVQAVTQGVAPWNPVVAENHGAAGIFGPPDRGLPETGVIALGEINAPGWVIADVDLADLRAVRADGEVRTRAHWAESVPRAPIAQNVTLA